MELSSTMYKRVETYLKKHSSYNAVIHVLAGVGIGILLTYPLAKTHPLRWGLAFLIVGLAGHLYPLVTGKK